MAGQIEESFRRRLDELPPATQRLLTVAAAEPTGDASTVWRAAARLGAGGHDAAPAEEAGLIELGATLRFRHPTVRSAAYAAAAMDDRRAAHRALADVTDANTDLDRRAWHLALAAEGPDEKVAAELERCAGRAQARGGLPAAAALLERSVSLTLDPAERARRTLGAASAHLEGGSFDRGATLLTSMDTTVLDEMGLARLDLLRARHAYVAGALRDAPSLLLRAAKRLEPLDVASASATYLAAMGAAVVAGNFAHGVSVTDVARAATAWPTSDAPPPPEALTRALARATVEGPAAAAPALRGALELAGGGASGREALPWLGFLESAATVLWDSPTLHRLSVERVTAAREVGALWVLAWALNTLTHVLILEGELEGAESLVAETIQIVEATGSNQVPWGGVLLAGWRGDGDSRRAIDDLIPRATARGDALALKDAQWASAILGNGMGRYDEALVIAKEADRQPWEWGSQLYFHELIEAAVRTGDIAEAVAAVERLGDMVKASGSDWGLGIHARCRALLSAGGLAEELYTEAIERLEHTAIRPEAARAHLLYGEWLRREYRRVDARYHLRTAYERLSAMGIHAFAERARRELGATGETVRKRTVGTRRELTPQETQVAKLARDGLSNPEIGARLFISARTVQYHLSKVFTTLGITSRAQLEHALQ